MDPSPTATASHHGTDYHWSIPSSTTTNTVPDALGWYICNGETIVSAGGYGAGCYPTCRIIAFLWVMPLTLQDFRPASQQPHSKQGDMSCDDGLPIYMHDHTGLDLLQVPAKIGIYGVKTTPAALWYGAGGTTGPELLWRSDGVDMTSGTVHGAPTPPPQLAATAPFPTMILTQAGSTSIIEAPPTYSYLDILRATDGPCAYTRVNCTSRR